MSAASVWAGLIFASSINSHSLWVRGRPFHNSLRFEHRCQGERTRSHLSTKTPQTAELTKADSRLDSSSRA